jgi:hypothetical protein
MATIRHGETAACRQRKGWARQLGLLIVGVGVAFALIGPFAGLLNGWRGVMAAVTAAAACWLGAALALAVGRAHHGPLQALYAMVSGMLLRMAVPLAACAVLQSQGGPLAEAGIVYYAVVFYLVTLTIDTALTLPSSSAVASTRNAHHG